MRPKKRLFEVHKSKVPNGSKHWLIIGRPNGARIRAWFSSEKDAKAEADKRNRELEDYGSKAYSLTASQRAQAEEAIRILEPYSLTLVDAANAVVGRLQAASKSITVAELVERATELHNSLLSRDEISLRHFETFLSAGRRLTAAFADVRTSELTAARIESWLSNLEAENGEPLAVASRNQVQRYVFGILKYGVKIGVLERNPLDGIDKARSRKMKPITVLTQDQAENLLRCASPEIIPFFAIGMFAGLRVDEIMKLDWKHINLVNRKIDLTWFTTKTLQPRWAPVSDNLATILQSHAKPEGSLIPRSQQRLRKLREKAEKAAGLWPWPNNAARHSYISYRLSLIEDVAKVALEAGHDPKTLAQWYRRPILKADAEAYFKISTNPSSATLP
jgi:integrase